MRVMVTVVDMTTPSEPGKEHTLTVANDDTHVVASMLRNWITGRVLLIAAEADDEPEQEDEA